VSACILKNRAGFLSINNFGRRREIIIILTVSGTF